jgi:hypothetical protein
MRPLHTFPIACLLVCVGCDRSPTGSASDQSQPVVEEVRIQRPVGPERLRAAEAMSFNDVSFLLRTGSTEQEVLKEITNRGLVDPITPIQARSLADYNASAHLIQEVQDPKYVLSYDERKEYLKRQSSRNAAVRSQAAHAARVEDAEEAEKRRQQMLQQKTLAVVEQKEREGRAREQAKLAYEEERTRLENEKQRIQASLNYYRRNGYTESSLTRLQQELKEVEQARDRLKAP